MEKTYKKLVRDNIPEIIENDNRKPITRVLTDDEFAFELERKLFEELNEVIDSGTADERINELADLYEVMAYLAVTEGKTMDDVVETAKKKRESRGGFDRKIFLEKVTD